MRRTDDGVSRRQFLSTSALGLFSAHGIARNSADVRGDSRDATQYRVVRSFAVAPAPGSMPALTRAPNGDLLVAYSTVHEPFPWGGTLMLVVSKDKARTWSKPRVVWRPEDPRITIQVANGLQTLSNGEVLLPVTYCLAPKKKDIPPNANQWNQIYDLTAPGYRREVRLLRSRDSGKTWTIEDPQLQKPWWRFGRLLETRDGRLIMPGGGWYVESRDFGKTWGPIIYVGTPFWQETNIVEAADGRLFSMLRYNGTILRENRSPATPNLYDFVLRRQFQDAGGMTTPKGVPRRTFATNFSQDGGKTWGPWHWTGVQGKMPDLLVLPSGRVLLAVGAEGLGDGSDALAQPDRKSFCTVFFSDDHGQTWTRDVPMAQIEPGSNVVASDSPVMCPLDGGKVLVVSVGSDRTKQPTISADGKNDCWCHSSVIGNVIEPARN